MGYGGKYGYLGGGLEEYMWGMGVNMFIWGGGLEEYMWGVGIYMGYGGKYGYLGALRGGGSI